MEVAKNSGRGAALSGPTPTSTTHVWITGDGAARHVREPGCPGGHGRRRAGARSVSKSDPVMTAASGRAAMFVLSVLTNMHHGCDIDNPLVANRAGRSVGGSDGW